MHCISIEDAQTHLPELIAQLQPGEEVQIMAGQKIVARLVGSGKTVQASHPRQPGSAVGTLTILSDDDEHLQDFKDYMP